MKNKMMISLLLMIIGTIVLGFLAPWWTGSIWIMGIALLSGLNIKQGILTGSVAFGMVWLGMALYMEANDNANIIEKTGALLGGLSSPMMVILTLIVALITGLLSGWLGSALGLAIRPKRTV